ncbi:hypothetical protein TYRP_000256 [Tyrophagus putrescentiae]|nr:hypothetical protein TYRP_000256 [Tyrophagus putrescentiae]
MAKLLYSNYERKLNPNEECKFEADTSWFRGFMKRFKIKSKLKELVAQKAKYDDKPTCEFIAKFEQTVSKEKYLPEQIFTVDEIGFKWKINGNFQEQVILLLGGNASGDFKLKPLMINYTEAPRALTVTEISTLTTMEHLNDERLKNAFDPLRNTYTDDLIDYFEIHSDLIEQYMAGDVQQQLRNGNNTAIVKSFKATTKDSAIYFTILNFVISVIISNHYHLISVHV